MNHIAVAIDGPSGAGKSSVARACAAKLGYIYVDTGAMYRTVGLYVHRKGISCRDREAVIALLPEIQIALRYGEDGTQHMFLNGEDVSRDIRQPEISLCASDVSALPEVRAFLLDMQRDLAKRENVIMDGRDIGTTILPDAQVKIFLTASAEERAMRRYKELTEKGTAVVYEDVLRELIERDHNDTTRAVSPLRQAEDAILIDTSDLDFEGSCEAVLRCVRGE